MSRALVEDLLSLDAASIPRLNGEDAFSSMLQWSSGHAMAVEFDPLQEQLVLRWRADGTACQQTVSLATTGPNFGGKRRWFWCPIGHRRVRKLYWCPVKGREGGGWYGRAALGLAYYSQRLGRSERPHLRAQRIRRRLGSEDGMDEPDKPKGMHWATYNRLLEQADELDDEGWFTVLGGILRSNPPPKPCGRPSPE